MGVNTLVSTDSKLWILVISNLEIYITVITGGFRIGFLSIFHCNDIKMNFDHFGIWIYPKSVLVSHYYWLLDNWKLKLITINIKFDFKFLQILLIKI